MILTKQWCQKDWLVSLQYLNPCHSLSWSLKSHSVSCHYTTIFHLEKRYFQDDADNAKIISFRTSISFHNCKNEELTSSIGRVLFMWVVLAVPLRKWKLHKRKAINSEKTFFFSPGDIIAWNEKNLQVWNIISRHKYYVLGFSGCWNNSYIPLHVTREKNQDDPVA